MYLSISIDDTLYFYQYLKTHILVAYGQFLLLIDVSIQYRAQQLQIYEIFNLLVLHADVSVSIQNWQHIYRNYIWWNMQAVMITEQQYSTCLYDNGQFCKINVPF